MAAVLEAAPADPAVLVSDDEADGSASEGGAEDNKVNGPIKFTDIGGGIVAGEEPIQVESLCMDCRENGTTTIFFTRIPHFREVVIMAFECPHCGCRNNEVQPASVIQDCGCRQTLSVQQGDSAALSRQVVKSETAVLSVPELEFEIPSNTQKGILSTVEGMLSQAAANLQLLQEERRAVDPGMADALDAFCARLTACAHGEVAFTLVLDDPAGNSFIEAKRAAPAGTSGRRTAAAPPAAAAPAAADGGAAAPAGDIWAQEAAVKAAAAAAAAAAQPEASTSGEDRGAAASPASDPELVVVHYERTREMSAALGLAVADEDEGLSTIPEIAADDPYHGPQGLGAVAAHRAMARAAGAAGDFWVNRYAAPEEVIVLPGRCFACNAEADTRMFQTSIPFFKDVIIMSNSCDVCGYRNSEIKAGGAISAQGREISLRVESPADLRRDVIKAESASVMVPEIDLEISTGSLGGLITTVEGLLARVKEELGKMHSFSLGDSARGVARSAWTDFFDQIDQCTAGDRPWTLVLRDPLANSFISPITELIEDDPRLTSVDYERSAEEDEEYGIAHLKELERVEEEGRQRGLGRVEEEEPEVPAC